MATTIGFTDTDTFAAHLKRAHAGNLELSAEETAVANRRLQDAYNAILAALVKRGVSKTNIDLWVQGEEFQLDIAAYLYFVNSAQLRGGQGKGADWLDRFDRRDELADVTLVKSDGTKMAADDVPVEVWDLSEDSD